VNYILLSFIALLLIEFLCSGCILFPLRLFFSANSLFQLLFGLVGLGLPFLLLSGHGCPELGTTPYPGFLSLAQLLHLCHLDLIKLGISLFQLTLESLEPSQLICSDPLFQSPQSGFLLFSLEYVLLHSYLLFFKLLSHALEGVPPGCLLLELLFILPSLGVQLHVSFLQQSFSRFFLFFLPLSQQFFGINLNLILLCLQLQSSKLTFTKFFLNELLLSIFLI